MRPGVIVGLAALLALAPVARAQVTLDLHALDNGQGQAAQPAPEKPERAKPEHPKHRRATKPTPRKPAAKANPEATPETPPAAASKAAPSPAPQAKAPPVAPQGPRPTATLPMAPPPGVSLAPIVVEPPATKPEPPQAPPIAADAGGGVEPIQDGLRVLFATSRADLTKSTEAAIKSYLASVPRTESTSFNVTAYAAGGPEDPSTPRRLSLSRALAIRSVMIADGVASARIYLRALGAAQADGPADRVDMVALGTNGLPRHGEQTKNEGHAQNDGQAKDDGGAKSGAEPPK
jgi:outer membrane protein OmpA-like peptidoglycan-associated protein